MQTRWKQMQYQRKNSMNGEKSSRSHKVMQCLGGFRTESHMTPFNRKLVVNPESFKASGKAVWKQMFRPCSWIMWFLSMFYASLYLVILTTSPEDHHYTTCDQSKSHSWGREPLKYPSHRCNLSSIYIVVFRPPLYINVGLTFGLTLIDFSVDNVNRNLINR